MDITDIEEGNQMTEQFISQKLYELLHNNLKCNGLVVQHLSADHIAKRFKIDYYPLNLIAKYNSPVILTYNGRMTFVILKKTNE